jgi:hypothetical protein
MYVYMINVNRKNLFETQNLTNKDYDMCVVSLSRCCFCDEYETIPILVPLMSLCMTTMATNAHLFFSAFFIISSYAHMNQTSHPHSYNLPPPISIHNMFGNKQLNNQIWIEP